MCSVSESALSQSLVSRDLLSGIPIAQEVQAPASCFRLGPTRALAVRSLLDHSIGHAARPVTNRHRTRTVSLKRNKQRTYHRKPSRATASHVLKRKLRSLCRTLVSTDIRPTRLGHLGPDAPVAAVSLARPAPGNFHRPTGTTHSTECPAGAAEQEHRTTCSAQKQRAELHHPWGIEVERYPR
jgi:hypothetical protein